MSRPLVSVIIPAYNAERYLCETLNNLLRQTLTDWEAVIVDDGSTDSTLGLARRFAVADGRFSVVHQSNQGPSRARNAGIKVAQGELLAFLDADDLWHPEKLRLQVDTLERENADLVFCQKMSCNAASLPVERAEHSVYQGAFSGHELFRHVIRYTNLFIIPSMILMRTRVMTAEGGFDVSLRSCEDWDLLLRLCLKGYRFFAQPEQLLFYRTHSDGMSRKGDFTSAAVVFSRHCPWADLSPEERRKPMRLAFRNCFTWLGWKRSLAEAKPMFDTYRKHDMEGYACRIMTILRHLLPAQGFWVVCRYLVIPVAWHLERWTQTLASLGREI